MIRFECALDFLQLVQMLYFQVKEANGFFIARGMNIYRSNIDATACNGLRHAGEEAGFV